MFSTIYLQVCQFIRVVISFGDCLHFKTSNFNTGRTQVTILSWMVRCILNVPNLPIQCLILRLNLSFLVNDCGSNVSPVINSDSDPS